MGAKALRYDLGSFFAPNLLGSLSYPSMADLLFDRNASWSQYAGTGLTPARTYEVGAFFQDDFRMSAALTLNLGVRYEYTGAPLGYFSEAQADVNNWAPRIGFGVAASPRDVQHSQPEEFRRHPGPQRVEHDEHDDIYERRSDQRQRPHAAHQRSVALLV